MNKQFKIIHRTFIPQIILSTVIILILFSLYFYCKWELIQSAFFSVMVTSLIFRFYPNVKTIGTLQFDLLGVTVNLNNSTIRYNFLDNKIESLKIKLKTNNGNNYFNPSYNSKVLMNRIEIYQNNKKEVYGFKFDNHDDFINLRNYLAQINENAKVILN